MAKKDNEKKRSESIDWDAEEYIRTTKHAGWYVGLGIVTIGLVIFSLVLGWWSFTLLLVLSAVALVVYSVRPPRVLHYSLTNKGLSENGKLYSYDEYKNFGVVVDGKKSSIVLTPRKRFAPRVTVYFPNEDGEKIVDAFGMRLPMEEVRMDFLDKLVKILRI